MWFPKKLRGDYISKGRRNWFMFWWSLGWAIMVAAIFFVFIADSNYVIAFMLFTASFAIDALMEASLRKTLEKEREVNKKVEA